MSVPPHDQTLTATDDGSSETASAEAAARRHFAGRRVAFVGKLGSMSRREAQRLVRAGDGTVVERLDASVDLVIVGESELLSAAGVIDDVFDRVLRERVTSGELEVVTETELWQRLGLVDSQPSVRRLYTPAMLAELLKVPVAAIRRWHRRGLIHAAREVRRLAYFDFQEVATARRLAELLAAGVSPAAIERKLAALAQSVPGVQRPLAQLSVIVEGKQLLLRQGAGLVDPQGQLRFDFGALIDDAAGAPAEADAVPEEILSLPAAHAEAVLAGSPAEMMSLAAELEDIGHLDAAADLYRTAMAAAGPTAEACFRLAELLYQQGDLPAARERYYVAIELDEDYVEARANLGCVLAETGELELAVAAFEGALRYHDEYPDVHYHLARTLDELGRPGDADLHWAAFLELAPDSPWAEEAHERLSPQP
ncbi:MAG TPA: MerR family transcriptional regulator [Pirellulales bacterium]|nr:MerR family transcriptional regulator [Pirellulales bacterium]